MIHNFVKFATWYFCIVSVKIFGNDFKGFDDTILFKIDWPGANQQFLVSFSSSIISKNKKRTSISHN